MRLRLLCPLRAGLPPRRHRPPAGDPGHEALPRRVARGVRDPRRHPRDHPPRRAGRRHRLRAGRPRRRPGARRQGLPGHRLRQPPLRRRHDAHRRPRVPPAARGDRDGRPPRRAPGRDLPLQHHGREGRPFEDLQRDYDAIAICAGAMDAVGPRHPGRGPRRRPVRRRLHEEGQPRRAARGGPQRRRHRRRLHRHGLLADEPPPRRRERHDRLPADALRARRRRGGARRDRARGRPHGVPGQPDRAARRGREADRGPVHPQQARRARRVRPPLAGPDPRLGVRRPGRHRDPGRLAGGRPLLPAGGVELRGRPRPRQGRSRRPTPPTSAASSPAATS